MKKLVFLTIAINSLTTVFCQTTENITEKFGLTLSLPIVNKIQYYDHYFEKNAYRTRYGGFSGGIYYRMRDDKISLIGGTAIADYKPIYRLTNEDHIGPGAHDLNVFFFDAIYHKKVVKMINALGGLNFSRYKYSFHSLTNTGSTKYSDKTLGLLLGAEFQPAHFLSTSVVYRPTIISFNQKDPYHYISLDLRFHIPFYNKRQRELYRARGEARQEKFKQNRPRLSFQKKVQ